MADEPIRPGDVVQAKSGGQRWTVAEIEADKAVCVDDKGNQMTFPVVTLKKAATFVAGVTWLGKKYR
jgi:hypothetical protein